MLIAHPDVDAVSESITMFLATSRGIDYRAVHEVRTAIEIQVAGLSAEPRATRRSRGCASFASISKDLWRSRLSSNSEEFRTAERFGCGGIHSSKLEFTDNFFAMSHKWISETNLVILDKK